MDERCLTVDDICKYLNVSNETVYKWIEQRAMPGHRVGRRWMFKQDDVDAWVCSVRLTNPISRTPSSKERPWPNRYTTR